MFYESFNDEYDTEIFSDQDQDPVSVLATPFN